MNVTKHIICELTGYRPGAVDVSQGDRGSRAVSCRLLENGAPWMIPEGAAVRAAYTLPDGTEGLYDALPDGSPAGEIVGNIVTVQLADQLMAQKGMAQVSILVIGPDGGQIATWPIRVMVSANSAARLTVPESMPPYGAGFAGKIFFGGADGTVTPLGLGDGVEIVRQEDGSYVLGSQRLDLSGYATQVWVQAGYQPKGDYLLAAELSAAIDTALAEAKASGLFDGDDGISPTVSVRAIDGGHRVTISGAEGANSFDVMDGEDGRGIFSISRTAGDGSAGSTDIYTIKYTDNTTKQFAVRNGADGVTPHIGANGNWYIGDTDTGIRAQGEQGIKGDTGATGPQGPKGDTGATGAQGPKGDNGADGKTPIKGADYYTQADKTEMVDLVLAALPRWGGGNY